MSEEGSLKLDPLFVGLTRPPLFLGVSLSFAMVNMLICITYYIQTSDLRVVMLGAVIHLIGYIICFKEPLFIELFIIKSQKCNRCKNKGYYGANSYDMY
jgi:type IV secretion system protein VirB3